MRDDRGDVFSGLEADEQTIVVADLKNRAQHWQSMTPNSGGEAECDTLPVNTRLPDLGGSQMVYATPIGQASHVKMRGRVWTPRFVTLLAVALVFLLGSSLYTLVFINGSAHLVEFGLSIALLIVALTRASSIPTRSFIPWVILLPVALLSLLNSLAFLVLATPPAQRLVVNFVHVTSLNQVITFGLLAAALISLVWLARPFIWKNRLLLLLIFAATAICAIYQHALPDETQLRQTMGSEALLKHLLLVVSMVLLFCGVLVAAQMEQVLGREKPAGA